MLARVLARVLAQELPGQGQQQVSAGCPGLGRWPEDVLKKHVSNLRAWAPNQRTLLATLSVFNPFINWHLGIVSQWLDAVFVPVAQASVLLELGGHRLAVYPRHLAPVLLLKAPLKATDNLQPFRSQYTQASYVYSCGVPWPKPYSVLQPARATHRSPLIALVAAPSCRPLRQQPPFGQVVRPRPLVPQCVTLA